MLLLVVMLLDSSPPELESFVELESVLWVSVEAELVALFIALRLGPGVDPLVFAEFSIVVLTEMDSFFIGEVELGVLLFVPVLLPFSVLETKLEFSAVELTEIEVDSFFASEIKLSLSAVLFVESDVRPVPTGEEELL